MEFFEILRPLKEHSKLHFSAFIKLLLKIAALLLVVKIIMQLFSAHPFFAELAFTYTDFVIGYLHWTFLGLISITLFAFFKIAGLAKISRLAFWIYFAGFTISEVLIFYKGASIWLGLPFFPNYFTILVVVSSLLPLSLLLILLKNLLSKQ